MSGSAQFANLRAHQEYDTLGGMPATTAGYFSESSAFDSQDLSVVTLARYAAAERLLMSGWLLGADRLGGRQAVLDASLGRGHVILFGFRPHFRGQSHATFKLLFNALRVEQQLEGRKITGSKVTKSRGDNLRP